MSHLSGGLLARGNINPAHVWRTTQNTEAVWVGGVQRPLDDLANIEPTNQIISLVLVVFRLTNTRPTDEQVR